jgi:hypothetical protein
VPNTTFSVPPVFPLELELDEPALDELDFDEPPHAASEMVAATARTVVITDRWRLTDTSLLQKVVVASLAKSIRGRRRAKASLINRQHGWRRRRAVTSNFAGRFTPARLGAPSAPTAGGVPGVHPVGFRRGRATEVKL